MPLAVLSRDSVDEWDEAVLKFPSWWLGEEVGAPTETALPLPAAALSSSSRTSWIDDLLVSDAFVSQLKLAGKMAPNEMHLRALLRLLDERRGAAIFDLIVQRLEVPEFRVSTVLAAVRRVLNVEGYGVLTVDDTARTVTLNFDLLKAQFGVSA